MKDPSAIQGKKTGKGEPSGEPATPRSATLVIVVTFDSGDDERGSRWEWRIRSVETGMEGRFQRVADVLAFVAAVSGHQPPL